MNWKRSSAADSNTTMGENSMRPLIILMMLAFANDCCLSQVALGQPASLLQQSFDIQIPWRPMPVVIGGKRQLVYELHLTNFANQSLSLKRIEVLDSAGAVLSDIRDSELTGIIGRVDHPVATADKALIPPGVRALAYLSVPLGMLGAPPISLRHRIEYLVPETSDRLSVQGAAFTVSTEPLVSVGPPLRGGPWVAIYDASWERGHRRVPYAVQGSVHIPGRFAIDWMKVDKSGKYFDWDGSKVGDWYGYGAEVLAVADSVVAATRDSVPESAMLVKNPARIEPEYASGNYIALDLGASHYAFYEHLKPGSIRVKAGDHVRRGSVIGLLGYTGESTGPHLHFHISDNNSPLNAEGLPYQLQRFKILGMYPSMETFGKSQPWSSAPVGADVRPNQEFPAPLTVVEFPSKADANHSASSSFFNSAP
jgi:murein DD-endopeptidase MepM/ murein hydrolase activator NlpD